MNDNPTINQKGMHQTGSELSATSAPIETGGNLLNLYEVKRKRDVRKEDYKAY